MRGLPRKCKRRAKIARCSARGVFSDPAFTPPLGSTNFRGGTSWIQQGTLRGNVEAERIWHAFEFPLTGISSLQIRFRGDMSRGNEDANLDNITIIGFD